jgi:hypothetical protein
LIFLGKEHSRINDQDFSVMFKDRHVAADIAQPAEGDNSGRALF